MFMRIILWKTKVLTESLHAKDFHIVDAMQVLKGTMTSLKDIRKDDASIANQIQASIEISSSKGVNAHSSQPDELVPLCKYFPVH